MLCCLAHHSQLVHLRNLDPETLSSGQQSAEMRGRCRLQHLSLPGHMIQLLLSLVLEDLHFSQTLLANQRQRQAGRDEVCVSDREKDGMRERRKRGKEKMRQ